MTFTFTEPNSVDLHIDGETDKCSRNEDVNFRFTGFGVIGKVTSHLLMCQKEVYF